MGRSNFCAGFLVIYLGHFANSWTLALLLLVAQNESRMFSSGLFTGLSAAAGAALAVGGFEYASLWPGSQLFGGTLIAPSRPGELTLTFDDGPNSTWTPRLLELLASHEIHASFFLVGKRAQAEPALVRSIATAGHLIGNHSWSHPNLAWASASRIEDELTRTSQLLEQMIGKPIRHFRPPFGARRPAVLRVAKRLGLTPVMWNAMTSDWKNPSADAIALQLTRKIDTLARHGRAANVVLHDGGHLDPSANRAPSIAATGQLIQRYRESHQFVTVEAWEQNSLPSIPR
jgi:peptidoglycan/xylan/chitin deacetylase (PgdA/CDA1 family)